MELTSKSLLGEYLIVFKVFCDQNSVFSVSVIKVLTSVLNVSVIKVLSSIFL